MLYKVIVCCLFSFVLHAVVSAQSVQFPTAAIVKDTTGRQLSLNKNSVSIKALGHGVSYINVQIEADSNLQLADIDIPVSCMVSDTTDLQRLKQNFHWLPGINAKPGQIISQHLFRSPAMIFTLGKSSLVLVPDIDKLTGNQPAPYYMSAEYTANGLQLHYGLADYRAAGHVYYEKTNRPFNLAKALSVGCYVLQPKTTDPAEVLKITNDFLWKRFAQRYTASALPQVISFEDYANVAYTMALERLWVDAGNDRGGITLSTFYDSATKAYRGRYFKDDLWFQSWFNNVRTAYGLYSWGKKLNQQEWQQKAVHITNLFITTPKDRGWFPTIYNSEAKDWIASSQKRGSVYHLPDNLWSAYWLMRFNNELHPVPGTDSFLLSLAEALLKTQNADGSFPTMIDAKTLAPDEVLNHTASSAMATWYLEELILSNKVPANKRAVYNEAIIKSLQFLSREVLPMQKFEDFESYFSCSRKPMHYYDSSTHLFNQNTLSMQWCAQAYLKAYALFKTKRWLKEGEYCLNILSLYQQVWNPPFINFYAFGGFGVQNTDAEWNDARQAQFAETYLQFYDVTKNKEYLERAIAACRASFALMVLPENEAICPVNYKGTEINGELWPGTMAENYGHDGYDRRSYQSGFHWGTGSALTTAAIFDHLELKPHKK